MENSDKNLNRIYNEMMVTDSVTQTMLYPGTCGIINQRIADGKLFSNVSVRDNKSSTLLCTFYHDTVNSHPGFPFLKSIDRSYDCSYFTKPSNAEEVLADTYHEPTEAELISHSAITIMSTDQADTIPSFNDNTPASQSCCCSQRSISIRRCDCYTSHTTKQPRHISCISSPESPSLDNSVLEENAAEAVNESQFSDILSLVIPVEPSLTAAITKEIVLFNDCTDESRIGTEESRDNDREFMNVVCGDDVCRRRSYSRDDLLRIGKSSLGQSSSTWMSLMNKFDVPIILDNNPIKYYERWRRNTFKTLNVIRRINLPVTTLSIKRTELGYIPFKEKVASGLEVTLKEEFLRQIKGILNRIVPENFDQCLVDLMSLKIDSYERMVCLVNELFIKAVNEETYSAIFAKLCHQLSHLTANGTGNETVTFIEVLLRRCQAMFATSLHDQLQMVRGEWFCKTSCTDDLEEQVKRAKDRYYGNIRFIGELYLQNMIITEIICLCIDYLINNDDNSDSLACLCKLFETCGSKLETEPDGKLKLDETFVKLRLLSESRSIPTRIRFRIVDLLELRRNKWSFRQTQQERRVEPKTFEEMKLVTKIVKDSSWRLVNNCDQG